MARRRELGTEPVYDRRMAGRLAQVFVDDLAHASRVTYEAWQARGLFTKLFEIFVAPIKSQL